MTSNVHPFARPLGPRQLRIGRWIFEPGAYRLQSGDEELRLTPKSSAVLAELARLAGQVVTREALIESVWPRGVPSQDLLNHAIKELRRALGDELKAPAYIETVPKVGYRMIAEVGTLEPSGAGGDVIGFPMRPAPPATPPRTQSPRALLVVLALFALLALGVPLLVQRGVAPVGDGPRLREVHFITSDPGYELWPRISPDGGFVAYTANPPGEDHLRLHVRAVDGTRSVHITREVEGVPYHEHFPVWSPDGGNVAFLRLRDDGECRVAVISALGGVERTLHSCRPFQVDYFDWTPDGRFLAVTHHPNGSATTPGAIALVDIESGVVRPLSYSPRSGEHDIDPRVSPDGRTIAFRRGVVPFSDLWVMPIGGGQARRVVRLGARIRGHDWLPDSSGLVFSSDHGGVQALYRMRFEDGLIVPLGESNAYMPDVATRRGRLVFQRMAMQSQLAEFPFPGEGPRTRLIAASSAGDTEGQFAPGDGRVVFISTRSGQHALWLYDPRSESTRQLVRPESGTVVRPRWSPDGTRITFTARRGTEAVAYVVDVATGKTSRVNPEGVSGRYGSFTPDGRALVYSEEHDGHWRVVQRELDGVGAAQVLRGGEGGSDPVMSTDGRHVYYTRVIGDGLYELDLASGVARKVSERIGYHNMDSWVLRPDGVLFMESLREGTMGIFRAPYDGSEPILVRTVEGDFADFNVSLSPDASSILLTERGREDSDLVQAELH